MTQPKQVDKIQTTNNQQHNNEILPAFYGTNQQDQRTAQALADMHNDAMAELRAQVEQE